MALMIVAAICFAVAIPLVLAAEPPTVLSGLALTVVAVLILFIAVLCLAFWLLYSAYYTVDRNGITVRYGPATHAYRWEEFETVHWRRGMFATKIGWPSVTPCVRLSNALALQRRDRWWPLYLTPNDPKAFAAAITRFAPELTQQMIM